MKKQIKRFINLFKKEKEEKLPIEIKREIVKKSDFGVFAGSEKGDAIIEGLAKGALIVENQIMRDIYTQEEHFKQKLFEDIKVLIDKHYDDETLNLRKEIVTLNDNLAAKNRKIESLKQSLQERMVENIDA